MGIRLAAISVFLGMVPHSALAISCDGPLTEVGVENTGRVFVTHAVAGGAAPRFPFCNVDTTYNSFTPDVCRSYYSLLLTA